MTEEGDIHLRSPIILFLVMIFHIWRLGTRVGGGIVCMRSSLCSLPDVEDHELHRDSSALAELPLPAAAGDCGGSLAKTLVGPCHCGPPDAGVTGMSKRWGWGLNTNSTKPCLRVQIL